MTLGLSFDGAHQLGGPLTAVDVWQLLHTNAQEWLNVPRNSKFFTIRELLDTADLDTLGKLREFESDNWLHLCQGAGWTVMGAVGSSWCKDGTFEWTAGYWQQVNPSPVPDEFTLRAASMLNPKILPDCKSLLELASIVQNDPFKIALVLAAYDGKLKIDVAPSDLENAPDILRPILGYTLEKSDQELLRSLASNWQSSPLDA